MTSSSPSALALHIQQETQRWDATSIFARQRQRLDEYGSSSQASSSSSSSSSSSTSDSSGYGEDDDMASLSTSLTSVDEEDEDVLPQPQPPLLPVGADGTPIPVYGSLDEAAAQSTAGLAEPPRRLVTPGKLYENEEEDDEILEYDDPHPRSYALEQAVRCGGG